MTKLWKECAASEARIKLIAELKNKKIGFNEIEQFGLGLKYSLKSRKLAENREKPIENVIQAAMRLKLRDEIHHNQELKKEKNRERMKLTRVYHQQTETYKKTMKYLKQEAEKERREQTQKYRYKIEHLEKRYREREGDEEDTEMPPGMEGMKSLSAFNAEKYERLEKKETRVHKIGDIELTREEEMILKRNPKFSIPMRLEEDTINKEMEKAFSLMRMELREEEGAEEREKETDEKEMQRKEEESKMRQVYDPLEKRYDEGKRRVTDLEECSRVVLPKPLSVIRETEIEMRREAHTTVYQEYRREFCNKDGEQKKNLTEEEQIGLKRIQKRIKDGDLVVLKTDKSGKMSVTDRDNYVQMGQEHVKNDKIITREEVKKTDKVMNEHSAAWCNMWGTGKHHGQEDRILSSKMTRSENTAKLYLTHKDHKKEPGKTRPIGTANCSNTRGFANCVSDLLEALANCEENSYEVISSEDLLSSTKEHNNEVVEMKKVLAQKVARKLECMKCKVWKIRCEEHSSLPHSPPVTPFPPNRRPVVVYHSPPPNPDHPHSPITQTMSNPPEVRVARILEEVLCQVVEVVERDEVVALAQGVVIDLIEMIAETRDRDKRKSVEECEDCMMMMKVKIGDDCEECGVGEEFEIPKMTLIGMDAVALFPSLSGKNTAKIVREAAEKTTMKMEGFDWKKGMVYVRVNRHLTRIRKEMKKFLPIRKSMRGTEPGMASEGLNKRKSKIENQWIFTRRIPTTEEKREMVGMVVEIAIRILWENYSYRFGGEIYLQKEGGPIGQRPTMAAARIVMNNFFKKYHEILKKANLKVTLLKVYVDDGRQVSTLLKRGMRFDEEREEFVWSREAEREDLERMEKGEADDEYMARLCVVAMNHINKDITFTTEVASEFSNKKLPTLDMNLSMKSDYTLTHSYFEKEMRSQILIEKESAMNQRQKFMILSNELTRRIYNIDEEDEEFRREVEATIENFTVQLKTSGWEQREAAEIVKSGYVGWRRRRDRRKEQGNCLYRSGAASLSQRTMRKLIGKETWYREDKKRKRDEYDEWEETQRAPRRRKKNGTGEGEKERNRIVAVMFVPYTPKGELAKRLREVEMDMEKHTGNKLKIIERSGTKLIDLIHKSDPWEGQDCGRENCILCETKQRTGRFQGQDCHKRCVVYETWCLTCEERERKLIEENENLEEEMRNKMMREIKLYKYVGETSRSLYERGLEHLRDLEELKMDSHMLKHYFDIHGEEEMKEMKFGAKIVDKPRKAFDRQISESVTIQNQKKKNHILNSKSEYNRCALPRLTANLGEKPMEKLVEKQKREEKEEERILQGKIRDLKVKRSRNRRGMPNEIEQPAKKRRKTGKIEFKRVINPETDGEKRKVDPEIEKTDPKEEKTKIRRVEVTEEEGEQLPEGLEYEGGRKKTDEELANEWRERIREREAQIEEEEKSREKLIEKAKKLQKGWELMRLCRETIEENGEKWKKSKESRDLEKTEQLEKSERLGRAEKRREETLELIGKRQIQQKITENLKLLPENRRKLAEKEEEKRRNLLMKEAEDELWRKWRQRKGRGMRDWKKVGENETLERKLEIVEHQVEQYKLELERIERRRSRRVEEEKTEANEKMKRLEQKRHNEKHWEMMRWITKFMKENKNTWERRRELELEKIRKGEEWEKWSKMTELEKIEMIQREKPENTASSREEKIRRAQEGRKRWKEWRENQDEKEYEEEADELVEPDNQLEIKGGVPQGPFLSLQRTLLLKNRQGTHQ